MGNMAKLPAVDVGAFVVAFRKLLWDAIPFL